jgi:acetyl-CoA synthetase
MTRLLTPAATYAETYENFRWRLPDRCNIADLICDRHAVNRDRLALIHHVGSQVRHYTFREIQRSANQFTNTLTELGMRMGDRLMVYLPQHPVTAIAHVACWKAGLISIPTSILFGIDGLEYRLNHAEVSAVVTDSQNLPKVLEAKALAPSLKHIFVIDAPGGGDVLPFFETIALASDSFATLMFSPDTPAMINYTSGTTGWPKGTLQAHRIVFGHIPGLEVLFDFYPQAGDRMWSPADWAWLGGIGNMLLGGWFHGTPLLVFPMAGFDPELTMRMMGEHRIRNAFLTPTMFKLLKPHRALIGRYDVRFRSIISGSEAVGKELLENMIEMFGATINEGFGQTEANVLMGNCTQLGHFRIGSIGSALPGHEAAIMDDDGSFLSGGEVGNLVFRSPDPVMMLRYWNDLEATAKKFRGDWLITGDLAHRDEDGFYWFRGRADDVITSSGYRIGPTEIEDAVLRHPSVRLSAVIGVPDPERTEIIRAYVVLADGVVPSDALAEEIRLSVRDRLAKHEYPREIRFVRELPMTTTGKILRRELRDLAKVEVGVQN